MLINILGLGDLADDTTPEFAWRVYVMDLYLNMFVDEDTLEQVSKMWDRYPSGLSKEEQEEWVAQAAHALASEAVELASGMLNK